LADYIAAKAEAEALGDDATFLTPLHRRGQISAPLQGADGDHDAYDRAAAG
jgi:hypothetical protein